LGWVLDGFERIERYIVEEEVLYNIYKQVEREKKKRKYFVEDIEQRLKKV
jgi:hypothetical protein